MGIFNFYSWYRKQFAKDIYKTQRGLGKSVVKAAKATSNVARQTIQHEKRFGSKGVYKGYKGGMRP
jgi:uncharacterized protein YhjY with autotransporter beta-barrel domain